MLEPVIKEFSIDTFNKLNNRFSVQFLYIINDKNNNIKHNENNKQFESIANKFRPEIPFYSITYSQFHTKYLGKNEFIKQSLKMNPKQIENKFDENGASTIYAITPSIKNKEFNGHIFDGNGIQKFIEMNRYSPVIELKLGNFKTLIENCNFFAIIFVNGKSKTLSKNALKFGAIYLH